jgi:4a-hydroxytetrahydrobiopterin dehydratase
MAKSLSIYGGRQDGASIGRTEMSEGNAPAKTYGAPEIEARLAAELPGWALRDGAIRRVYRTHGWKGTLMVVNAVGHLAEAAWHHPGIHASWSTVEVSLNTHDAGGVTEKDFQLARKIEEVVTWRPENEGGALTGTPQDPRHAYVVYD